MKTNETHQISIQSAIINPLQTGGEPDTSVAKPANGEDGQSECLLRNTCKMPTAYCNTGRCKDWFF